MPSYCCYFRDDRDNIGTVENFDADAQGDAIERALAMLKGRPHYRAIEVWQGGRRLYPRGTGPPPGDPSPS